MAITAFKTFINGEVLLASDLNSSLTTIIDEVNTHGTELDTINASPQGFAKNLAVNGDLAVWQRGSTFSLTSSGLQSYTADLFRASRQGSVATVTKQEFTLGQTDVSDNPSNFMRTVITTSVGVNNHVFVRHEMEDVKAISGAGSQNQATISFWAKADDTKNMAVEFVQHFGTGGSPSADVTGNEVTTINLTTSWTKFTKTFNMPSVSGKTLGTQGDDKLNVVFWFEAGSDFDARTNTLGQQSGTFELANVQIEMGSEATSLDRVAPAVQTMRAQQYYNPGEARHNLIINGDFSVWQRGTSQTVGGYGSADRWDITQSGATHTSDQQVFTLGQTDVPNNPKYFFRHDVTTGNDFTGILQRVEDVTKTAGQPLTLSFWAKGTNPGGGALSLRIRQHFGSGGSPSSNVDVDAAPFVLTSSWQKFTYTFTPSSVSGKTLGTDGNDYMYLLLGQGVDTATDAWQLDIANVQLEFGTEATEFEYVSPADQLARCQRYFERFESIDGDQATIGSGYAESTTVAVTAFTFAEKRAIPNFTGSGSAGDFNVRDTAPSNIACTFNAVFDETKKSAMISVSRDSGTFTTKDPVTIAVATNGTLDVDAEL